MAQLFQPGAPFHGTYTIVRMIGRGGIGEVYEAKHDFLGRRVAIKAVRLRSSLPKTAAQRMAKEAQALCALDHPNIIRIHDAGAEGDVMFMVTELLDGGTLRDKLEAERRLQLLPALRYHVEWTDALVQVHAAGIIHRDLKPENVFITKAGVSKLLDFGAALDSQRITMIGHTVGTPAYMAPEHLTGDVDIDARADVYPIGVMLFESLTGMHPFVNPNDHDLPDHFEFARRHLMDPWPKLTQVLPGTPPAIEAIVDRCLAKNRDERFPSMAALREALKTALEDANRPSALPLVQRVPEGATNTKPLPRQTAMRLERGATMLNMRKTEPLTPAPPLAGAASVVPGVLPGAPPIIQRTAPMDPAGQARAVAPTMEESFSRASATPAPPTPPMAVAMTSKPLIPSRAPAAIAILSFGVVAIAITGWLLARGEAPPANTSAASAIASSAPAPPPVTATSAPEAPSPPATAAAAAESPTEAPSSAPASASAASPAPPVAAPPKPRVPVRPRPAPENRPPAGPVPIFER